jgi:hypothetical protein
MTTITLKIPDNLYQQMRRQAQVNKQSVDELAQQTLSRFLPAMLEVEDDLPPALQVELKAMEHLSNAALWSLARGQLGDKEQDELERLGEIQNVRPLTEIEKQRQEALLTLYDELLLRRAHAAVLLQGRGHDVSLASLSQT